MTDAIVSVVAEQLIQTIAEQINSEISLVRGVDEEVRNLANELETIRSVLDNAENRRFRDDNINRWLWKLEHASHELEDVLDEWNYALLNLKMAPPEHDQVCFLIPSCLCYKKVAIRHDIAKKIRNVKEKLDHILRERERYNLVISAPTHDRLPDSLQVQSTSLVDLEHVHGRDRDRDDLVSKLIEESGSHILSIVGMGGLGKTTLAQLVYNHYQVEKFFDLKIWICVSDPFDPAIIAKGILEKINGGSPNTNQLDILLGEVKKSIAGKKFLLVLDDVWTEDNNKWQSLQISLRFGGVGSKILVTTRNSGVGLMMGSRERDICRPILLSNENCWLLLCHMSRRNEVKFEEVGKKIAQKCNGLPLAARTLGSLLRFKSSVEEWENVLNSEIWEMEQAEVDLFPHLLMSYNELSPTLKRCFSYCAVFPKDCQIDVENLITNWMALGYLGSKGSEMELRGRENIDTLVTRSLFQDFEKNDMDKVISCKMHDIVHDFAQFVRKSGKMEGKGRTCLTCDPLFVSCANEYRASFFDLKRVPQSLCNCLTCLKVLSMRNCKLTSVPQWIKNLIHLRSLDLSGNLISNENLKIIFQLYYLQTLKLAMCGLKDVYKEIENLIHLRHLDLSYNMNLKELPSEIGNLIDLRELILEFCDSLEELPKSICDLHKLQRLDIQRCKNLIKIPKGLGESTCLLYLTEFKGGSSYNKFRLLKKLNKLHGYIRLIIKLSGDDDMKEVIADAQDAEFGKKIHLKRLIIRFEDEMDENEEKNMARMDVIDALQPPLDLFSLTIERYKGSKLRMMSWMLSPLNQVSVVVLGGCNQMSSLPHLGKLPCLEIITISGMNGLKLVGREFLGMEEVDMTSSSNTFTAFPKLKKLTFLNCENWKEWEDMRVEEEQHSTIMPCLSKLEIYNCRSLKKLPRNLLRKAWPIQNLHLYDSEELEQHCRDNGILFI